MAVEKPIGFVVEGTIRATGQESKALQISRKL